jgi:hypothetical protein
MSPFIDDTFNAMIASPSTSNNEEGINGQSYTETLKEVLHPHDDSACGLPIT